MWDSKPVTIYFFFSARSGRLGLPTIQQFMPGAGVACNFEEVVFPRQKVCSYHHAGRKVMSLSFCIPA